MMLIKYSETHYKEENTRNQSNGTSEILYELTHNKGLYFYLLIIQLFWVLLLFKDEVKQVG